MKGGIFVTGTDTNVGKTVVSAWLARQLDADYWKPIQSGTSLAEPSDGECVGLLSGLPKERIYAPTYSFRAPLSPDQAAALEQVQIDATRLQPPVRRTARPLVVEGAGGLLVPINPETLMIDLIQQLGFPVVLVARSGLGTINHTLLSLEALRARRIPVVGVILNGEFNPANRNAIEKYGAVAVLAEVPVLSSLQASALEHETHVHAAWGRVAASVCGRPLA